MFLIWTHDPHDSRPIHSPRRDTQQEQAEGDIRPQGNRSVGRSSRRRPVQGLHAGNVVRLQLAVNDVIARVGRVGALAAVVGHAVDDDVAAHDGRGIRRVAESECMADFMQHQVLHVVVVRAIDQRQRCPIGAGGNLEVIAERKSDVPGERVWEIDRITRRSVADTADVRAARKW